MADDRSSFLRGVSMFIVSCPALPELSRLLVLATWAEQSARNQLLVSRNDMIRDGGDGAVGIGITAAEIAARAHEHVNDGFEFLIAEVVDRAGMTCAPQDSDVSGRNVVEMFLVAGRRKELGFIENA